jgi:hypothetical protein
MITFAKNPEIETMGNAIKLSIRLSRMKADCGNYSDDDT